MNGFKGLNKLEKLDLEWNQIEQIDTNGFQGLEHLEELGLVSKIEDIIKTEKSLGY